MKYRKVPGDIVGLTVFGDRLFIKTTRGVWILEAWELKHEWLSELKWFALRAADWIRRLAEAAGKGE